MFHVFEAYNADSLWCDIADHYKSLAPSLDQPSRVGMTTEILHAALSLQNPRQRWIHSRTPAINVAFALVETVWIMRGRSDSAFLNFFNGSLPEYAGKTESYHGAYGYRLMNAFGFNQLERAYNILRFNPDSRQVVLQIWNPSDDMPDEKGVPVAADIPCNTSSILKVRNGRLEWLQVMRSNDFFRGLPYNIVQFTTLQEVLAGWLNLELGAYNHISDSLHVYQDAKEHVWSSSRKGEVINSDNISISKEHSDQSFLILERLIDNLILKHLSPSQLDSYVKNLNLPEGYRNQAFIISAEAARRMGREDIARSLARQSSNQSLLGLFEEWLCRVAKK